MRCFFIKAKIEGGYDHKRQTLADIVPLEAPFTLFISPTHKCNFRCFYCTHSQSVEEKRAMGFQAVDLSGDLLKNLVKQASEFQGKLKRVVFTGLGEPLMNPALPDMIHMFSKAGTAGSYEIITNAYLLTPQMTDRLLEAGLTYLRVSIQGVNERQYKNTAGVEVDYERLVSQLSYFYEHKGKCQVYIKTMDSSLEQESDKESFYKTFAPICDKVYIEHLVKAQPKMTGRYEKRVNSEYTFFNEPSEYREVCPYMFYVLQADSIGNVFPCPPLGFSEDFSLGNVLDHTLYDMWHGEKLRGLRLLHLNHGRGKHPVCGKCENYLCFTPSEDNLDSNIEAIKKRMEAGENV